MRGKAAVSFHKGNYKDLYSIMESREFESQHHPELQEMWWGAHYKEAEKIRARPLGEYFLKQCFYLIICMGERSTCEKWAD